MLFTKKANDKTMTRKTRKNCYIERGKECFGFDKNRELMIYRYLCDERLTRKEFKNCKQENVPNNFKQWEENIRKRYEQYDSLQLEEFERYLKVGMFRSDVYQIGDNYIYAAMLSAFFATLFSDILAGIMGSANLIALVIIVVLILGGSIVVIKVVLNVINRKVFERKMFIDYKDIIKQLKEKNKK